MSELQDNPESRRRQNFFGGQSAEEPVLIDRQFEEDEEAAVVTHGRGKKDKKKGRSKQRAVARAHDERIVRLNDANTIVLEPTGSDLRYQTINPQQVAPMAGRDPEQLMLEDANQLDMFRKFQTFMKWQKSGPQTEMGTIRTNHQLASQKSVKSKGRSEHSGFEELKDTPSINSNRLAQKSKEKQPHLIDQYDDSDEDLKEKKMLKALQKKIKMPKRIRRDPTKMFREAVENAVDSDDPQKDIQALNTSPEVIGDLMDINKRKNVLLRAAAKDDGYMPGTFNMEDVADSFFIDNSQRIGQIADSTNFAQVKRIINLEKVTELPHEDKEFNDPIEFLILRNDGWFSVTWDIVIGLFCIFSSFFYAYVALFGIDPWNTDEVHEDHDEENIKHTLDILFFTLFALDMVKNFMTDFQPVGAITANRNFMDIASRYAYGEFPMDLICLAPFNWMFTMTGTSRFVFYIKVFRLQRAASLISVQMLTRTLQAYLRSRSKQLIEDDPQVANDPALDHNYIGHVAFFGYVLRTIQNTIIFFALAYFGGILWLFWCHLSLEYFYPEQQTSDKSFLLAYDLNYMDRSNPRVGYNVITVIMYFMMTTMSTVGFGDLHPKSDAERLMCVVLFLVGGTFFSIIMGDFLDIFDKFISLRSGHDEGEQLSQFIGLLRYFNNDVQLNEEFRLKLRAFFQYRWSHDQNQAISGDFENEMLMELPDETQDELFAGYLFKVFLRKYFLFFAIPIGDSTWGIGQKGSKFCDVHTSKFEFVPRSFYNWKHQTYRDFMCSILGRLRPRFESAGYILMGEMDECLEVFFLNKGIVGVGFDINRIRHMALKWENFCVVGGFNCTFYQRSNYIWKCKTDCEGWFMFKQEWINLLAQGEDIGKMLKKQIFVNYLTKIRGRLELAKKRALEQIQSKAHHSNIQIVQNKDMKPLFDISKSLDEPKQKFTGQDSDDEHDHKFLSDELLIAHFKDAANHAQANKFEDAHKQIAALIDLVDVKDRMVVALQEVNDDLRAKLTPAQREKYEQYREAHDTQSMSTYKQQPLTAPVMMQQ